MAKLMSSPFSPAFALVALLMIAVFWCPADARIFVSEAVFVEPLSIDFRQYFKKLELLEHGTLERYLNNVVDEYYRGSISLLQLDLVRLIARQHHLPGHFAFASLPRRSSAHKHQVFELLGWDEDTANALLVDVNNKLRGEIAEEHKAFFNMTEGTIEERAFKAELLARLALWSLLQVGCAYAEVEQAEETAPTKAITTYRAYYPLQRIVAEVLQLGETGCEPPAEPHPQPATGPPVLGPDSPPQRVEEAVRAVVEAAGRQPLQRDFSPLAARQGPSPVWIGPHGGSPTAFIGSTTPSTQLGSLGDMWRLWALIAGKPSDTQAYLAEHVDRVNAADEAWLNNDVEPASFEDVQEDTIEAAGAEAGTGTEPTVHDTDKAPGTRQTRVPKQTGGTKTKHDRMTRSQATLVGGGWALRKRPPAGKIRNKPAGP